MPNIKIDGREIPSSRDDTIINAAHRASIGPGLSVMTTAGCAWSRYRRQPPATALDILRCTPGRTPTCPRRSPSSCPPASKTCAGHGGALRVEAYVDEARSLVQAPAPQPPGQLPHLRPGRRVPPPGLLARPRPQAEADTRGAGAQPKGVVFGPTIVYDAERCISIARAASASRPSSPRTRCSPSASAATWARSPSPRPPARPRLHADDRARLCPGGALTSSDSLQGACGSTAQRARFGLRHGVQRLPRLRPAQQPYRHRPRENMAVSVLDVRRGHSLLQARRGGSPAHRARRRRRRRHHRGRALRREGSAQGPRGRSVPGRDRPLGTASTRTASPWSRSPGAMPRRGRLLRLRRTRSGGILMAARTRTPTRAASCRSPRPRRRAHRRAPRRHRRGRLRPYVIAPKQGSRSTRSRRGRRSQSSRAW